MTAVLEGLECPPLHYTVPEHVATYGPEVADLAAAAGIPLDPEQRLLPDACFAVDETDRLVATEVGCAAPRQTIKTHGGKACSLADLVIFRVPNALWSAHLRDTAYEVFRNQYGTGLADLFENYDWLRRLVYEIKDSDGGERSITLRPLKAGDPKPSLKFVARSERGGRGLSGERVTFDEALFLKPSMTAAMVPILSSKSMEGQVQVRYLGSPGLLSSASWRSIRDRGRSGLAKALAWLEFGTERTACMHEDCSHAIGAPGCALDREDLIRAANLAIGRRMDLRFVMETERESLTPADFMRERMGWWDDPPEGGGVLDLAAWAMWARHGEQRMVGPVLSVEVAPDRSESTIGAGWWIDGKPHLEVVEDRPGTDGVVARCKELAAEYQGRRVVLDADTEAAGFKPALEDVGLDVVMVSRAQRVAACGRWFDLGRVGGLTHNGDPELAEAIKAARWKDVGDGARVLSRKESAGDIKSLYAIVLALFGLEQAGVYVLEGSLGR